MGSVVPEDRPADKGAYVYILRCADGSLYTGWTTDPARRLAEHNRGQGAKYTRSRRPAELVYQERCESRPEAMRRERQIKQLTREQKLALIRGENCPGDP